MQTQHIDGITYEIIREEPIQTSGKTMLYMKRPKGNHLHLAVRYPNGQIGTATRLKHAIV